MKNNEAIVTQPITEDYPFVVPFFDVDSLNIVWHGNYCKYLELARCKLLDKVGYNYRAMAESGFSFPVVDMHIKYIRPIIFEQAIVISATLAEWQYRLQINYVIRDAHTSEKLTKARTIQAAVELGSNRLHLNCPPVLNQKINNFRTNKL
ncbi:MAG: acyl-CoA thioesterase [Moraxellaceae bacterium]|nr:MAG: acyl-CoA thioesterase [Moraxellaceae bacterium]